MKICVLGNGILFDEFKRFDFTTNETDFFKLDQSELNEFDTIINTYNKSENSDTSVSAMYVYNAHLPAMLSDYCEKTGKTLVHVSTGDIYDNSTSPQSEESTPSVKTAYEASKLLGEQYCTCKSLIIRTKNMFNSELTPDNSLYQLMKSPSNVDLPVSFSHTKDVVRSITRLLKQKETGTFNVTSNGTCVPFVISPVAEYLKKESISELNLTKNCVTVLNTSKLFKHHITEPTEPLLLECFSEISYKLKYE